MKRTRVVMVFLLLAGAALAAEQSPPFINAGYGGQKAEPNAQLPAIPQANTGNTLGQPDPASDAALQGRIQEALRNEPTLAASHISVNVTNTAIELSGTAASGKDKQTAERIAQSFDGNRQFNDKLVVTGAGTNSPGGQGSNSNPQASSGANNPRM